MKIFWACVALIIVMPLIAAALITQVGATLTNTSASTPDEGANIDIPSAYLVLYEKAATTCPGLDWSILAAVGKIETNHGRSPLPGVRSGSNYAGAQGPMQFLPTTFASYSQPTPPGGAEPPSPYDPADAIYAAARMLCANGAHNGMDIRSAIFSYNRANWYVDQVLAQAQNYASTPTNLHRARVATIAVAFAYAQLGKPYVWGGNGNPGFDCSGLTQAAYRAAGINLARTAQEQYDQGTQLPHDVGLQPGDLLFYGTPTTIHHVGIFIGNGRMIDAPDFGQVVKIQPYRYPGDDYVGSTRPKS